MIARITRRRKKAAIPITSQAARSQNAAWRKPRPAAWSWAVGCTTRCCVPTWQRPPSGLRRWNDSSARCRSCRRGMKNANWAIKGSLVDGWICWELHYFIFGTMIIHNRETYQPTSVMRWDRDKFNGSIGEWGLPAMKNGAWEKNGMVT